MDEFLQSVYLREVQAQSKMAMNAAGAFDHLQRIDEENRDNPNYDSELHIMESFRTLHSFLTHLSNVSRLVWPPSFAKPRCACKKHKLELGSCYSCRASSRAFILQQMLEVVGVEHILKNRELRDHLEHFDERLDEWRFTSKNRIIVSNYFGPEGGICVPDNSDIMRGYDPANGDFTFRGEKYSVVDLYKGVEDILIRINRTGLLR